MVAAQAVVEVAVVELAAVAVEAVEDCLPSNLGSAAGVLPPVAVDSEVATVPSKLEADLAYFAPFAAALEVGPWVVVRLRDLLCRNRREAPVA